MKSIYLLFFFTTLFCGKLFSQVTGCFEIQSILVDACGSPEEDNEMVSFQVGLNDLNTNNLEVDWNFNAYLGICQDNTTESTTDYMNSTIESCGYFVEPEGGLLPANAKVLLITSSDFDATSHSYAGLEDTIYVIFQCAGNTQGHFANWTNGCDPTSGDRTTSVDFGGGCSQTVTYNKCELVDQAGEVGNSNEGDGAKVNFDSDGNPSYLNEGCVIPYNSVEVNAELLLNDGELCPGESVNLSGEVINSDDFVWNSSNGTFSNSLSLLTEFTVNLNTPQSFYIYLSAENGCNEPVKDSILITMLDLPEVSIDTTILSKDTCYINEMLLEANGANSYEWSTGNSESSIIINSAGEYSVVGKNECGSDQDTVLVDFDLDCDDTIPPNDTIPDELEDFEIEIPNIFTPNKDKVNDFFGVWTNLEVEIDFLLLNRWGNVVKKGNIQTSVTDLNELWDGRVNEREAVEGTYFYKINIKNEDVEEKVYQGYFQLVR